MGKYDVVSKVKDHIRGRRITGGVSILNLLGFFPTAKDEHQGKKEKDRDKVRYSLL